ncbi:hypothetical protein ACFSO7_17215 [Bacillus sp. CGMCC 1.16607]|uniref:hypothetical protein n=1 Tax=Bacillus sp. CGMCC 1.16607 TaxID=3351842 RepID=UPI00362A910A
MKYWMEKFKEDVNNQDGAILTYFTIFTSYLFKGTILLAIPIFLYFLIKAF